MLYFMTALVESSLLTTLLTGGLGLTLALLYVYASQEAGMEEMERRTSARCSKYTGAFIGKYIK
jgi:hypothetical protein